MSRRLTPADEMMTVRWSVKIKIIHAPSVELLAAMVARSGTKSGSRIGCVEF
jgi:hypothetical protein